MTRTWPPLQSNQVHLWQLDLRAMRARQEFWRTLLSPEEIARANRFRFVEDAARFICAHGARREILAFYTRTSPHKLQFSRNDFGKPFLTDNRVLDLRFNLAYGGETALFVVAQAQEIGVDIERCVTDFYDNEIEPNYLSATIFSENERREFLQWNQQQKTRAFFRLWTRKEAVLKALGRGFSLDARQLEIGFAGKCGVVHSEFDDEKPYVYWRDLNLDEKYVATLATQNDEARLLTHNFP